MPELPEVETVRSGLEDLLVGKSIVNVSFAYPRMVLTGADQLAQLAEGQTFQAIRRRGKYLLLDLDEHVIISHLRMEGKYLSFPSGQVPANKHFHAFFDLSDGTTLVYQDVRKFGTMEMLVKGEEEAYFQARKLGPEPTVEEFDLATFKSRLQASKKSIKPYLLEQTLVVGLGNIYVDEVLWASRVHPLRPSNSLKPSEIKCLHEQTIGILALAVEKRGSTIRSYKNAFGEIGTMQDFLKVYGRTGQACPRCQTSISKLKVGGRGSHICPKCQKI